MLNAGHAGSGARRAAVGARVTRGALAFACRRRGRGETATRRNFEGDAWAWRRLHECGAGENGRGQTSSMRATAGVPREHARGPQVALASASGGLLESSDRAVLVRAALLLTPICVRRGFFVDGV